jgi:MFS superfamily sulfate permease-like transporter
VVAACTIAAVAVPQGLAYAKLAEVEPVHGTRVVLGRLMARVADAFVSSYA